MYKFRLLSFYIAINIFLVYPETVLSSAILECANNETETSGDNSTTLNKTCGDGQLYHVGTDRCYLTNEQGPCGELMKFIPDPANINHGYCDCDDYDFDHNNCTYRPKFFWPQSARCYFAYQRGPCKENEWLVLNRNSSYYEGYCAENPCPQHNNSNPTEIEKYENNYWFDFVGSCYKTGTQGFCSYSNYKIYLMPYQLVPLCLPDTSCGDFIKSFMGTCEGTGERRYVGKCRRKKVTFSFP